MRTKTCRFVDSIRFLSLLHSKQTYPAQSLFSPNSVSTLWGSYGRSKEWCPSRCPSATAAFDCAGSHRVPCATTVSHGMVAAGFWVVLPGVRALFEAKRSFTWQVQEIGWLWRIETWVYVAGARNRTHCENRGRRSILWTWPKRWQACVIRRIAFYVAGTGNTHHGSYILRSKGSIPEKGCIFGIWTWGSVCVASAAFRMTSGHDFVAGAVLLKHVSIFVEVSYKTLVLELRIFSFRGSLPQNARFGSPDLQFSRKSPTKRSFWSSGASVFVEVSHKTLVLELRIFSFRGSLAQNARFGSPDLQFSRKSRTKHSFWKSGSSVFEEVSQNLLVYNILMQVAQNWILTQRSWDRDLAEVVLQDPDRSDPTGSWYRDLAQLSW